MINVTVRERHDRINLQLAYTDPVSGFSKTKSAGTDNWKKAERAASKWESELMQRHGISATGWDIFRTRFEDEHLETLEPDTAKQYGYSLDRFEREMGRPRDINLVTTSTMSQFAAKLRKAKPKLSDGSIASKLRQVKSALGWAVRIGTMDSAPMITLPSTGSRGRPLTFTEVIRFFTTTRKVVATEHREAITTLVKVMWLGGLRLSESLKLSFDRPPVEARLTSRMPAIHWRVDGQKGKRSEVTIMPPDLYRFLLGMKRTTGPVVNTELSKRQIQGYLTAIGRTAKIEVSDKKCATAHDLRRTFGNRTALRVHPFVLKHLMRHKNIQTTMKYYVDLPDTEIGFQIWKDVHGDVHEEGFRMLKPRGPRLKKARKKQETNNEQMP